MNSDPVALNSFYHTTAPNARPSLSHLSDPALDKLLEQGVVEADETKRKDIYKNVQRYIIDNAVIIPVYIFPYTVAASKSVSGIKFDSLGYPLFNDASILKNKEAVRMVNAIIVRFISSLGVIIGSSILVFCVLYVLPGDVVMNMIDPSTMSPEAIANLRHQLGVDRPFLEQFTTYFSHVLVLDFGKSLVNSEPVLPKIMTHFPATLALTAAASLVSVTVGLVLGSCQRFIVINRLISSPEWSGCSVFLCRHSGQGFCLFSYFPCFSGGCLR